MIKVNLEGGLGNQLFQYAYGLALSKKWAQKIILDATPVQRAKGTSVYTKRMLELDKLGITELTLDLLNPNFTKISDSLLIKVFGFRRVGDDNAENALAKRNYNSLLKGYFQNVRLIEDIRSLLLSKITVNVSERSQWLIDNVASKNSISLHVRRGDYLTNPAAANFHGICHPQYYYDAIHFIRSRQKIDSLLVFSDDIEWCRTNLIFDINTTYVDHTDKDTSFEDMIIMKFCKNNVIANSTFSWWGAWLNEHKDKVVIAPKNWFLNNREPDGLIPEGWVRL